jgi:putative membrane protein
MRFGTRNVIAIVGVSALAAGCGSSSSDARTAEAWESQQQQQSAGYEMMPQSAGYEQTSTPAPAPEPTAMAPSEPSEAMPTGDTSRTDAGMQMNDEQIIAIISAMDQKGIEVSKLVSTRSKNKDVKTFASSMAQKGQDWKNKRQKVTQKMGVTPQPTEKSDTITKAMKDDSDALKQKSGAELDQAYVDLVIMDLKQGLDFIDNQAMGNVKNADLKASIEEMRPMMATQLQNAEDLGKKIREAPPQKEPKQPKPAAPPAGT